MELTIFGTGTMARGIGTRAVAGGNARGGEVGGQPLDVFVASDDEGASSST